MSSPAHLDAQPRRYALSLLLAVLYLGGALPQPARAGEVPVKETIEVFMVAVGPDLDAQGRLRHEQKAGETAFSVELKDLQAGSFDLELDGVVVSQLVTVGSPGEVIELKFQDPVEPNQQLLDFNPLGTTVVISQGGQDFLSAVMPAGSGISGVKSPSSAKKNAQNLGKNHGDSLLIKLANVGALAGAQGTARLTQGDAGDELQVQVQTFPPGAAFTLLVDGTPRGTLPTDAAGSAQLTFQTPLGDADALLDFPVKGRLIQVLSGEDEVLAAVFPISAQGALGKLKLEKHELNLIKVNLTNQGLDLDATGLLTWKLTPSGRGMLTVKIRDLPAGSYDLVVDGVVQGDAVLVVKHDDGGVKVIYDTMASSMGNKLLLLFSVVGTSISITPDTDNATVLLQTVVE